MNCLSIKQIADYMQQDKKSDTITLHLSTCNTCRKTLLKMHADTIPSFFISNDLTKKTLGKINENYTNNKNVLFAKNLFLTPKKLFALAASLLLLICASMFFSKHIDHEQKVVAIKKEVVQTKIQNKLQNSDSGSIAQTMKLWLDTKEFKNIKEIKPILAIPSHQDGTVIHLSAKTGILTEPKTILTILKQTDTTISIELLRGNALFSVQKKHYQSFCVKTPNVQIHVTGTVFSVFVDSTMTKVNVLEGSVQLIHDINTKDEQALEQGNEAIVNSDSIAANILMDRVMARERGPKLRDYLQSTVFDENIMTTKP